VNSFISTSDAMKKAFTYLLIAFGLALYSAAFGEIFMRVFAPQSFVPRLVAAAPYGVRMNAPGAVYRQHTPEVRAVVRINDQGMRADRDFSLQKPEGVSRIAIFGDSYFLGYEADIEDIAATRLEEDLRAANCPVEVLNFSVSGFGAGEMLRTLEAKGMAFQPDVVIFQWHHTDPDDDRRSNLYALDEEGRLKPTGESYVPAMSAREFAERNPAYRLLSQHSHLFVALREHASRFVRRVMAGHVFSRRVTDGIEESDTPASAVDVAILAAAETRAKAGGADFFVVDVPGAQSRTRFRSSFRLLPADVAARANYVSTVEAFEHAASLTRKLYWERGHRHLTPAGNAVIARATAEREE